MMNNSTAAHNNNLTGGFTYTSLFRPAYDIPLLMLAFFIVVINVFVILLFIRKSYLRTKTNSFLISLAISDLTTGVLSIPLYIFCTEVVNMCHASAVLYRCMAVSTMAHILVVTLERYVAVIYPMRYYRMVTKQRVCIIIAMVWIFSVFYSVLPLTWINFSPFDHTDDTQKAMQEARRYDIPYQITGFIVCFLLPLVIMIVCVTQMLVAIRHQVETIRKQAELAEDPRSRSIASDKRALLIFSTMLGIFVLCWLSWYITTFEVNLGRNHLLIPDSLADVLDFLRFGTSLFNPLLYTFLKNDFRRAVKSRCSCVEKLTDLFTPRDSNSNIRMTLSSDLNGRGHQKSGSFNSNMPPHEESNGVKKDPLEATELISKV